MINQYKNGVRIRFEDFDCKVEEFLFKAIGLADVGDDLGRDVIEIVMKRPEVFHFARHCITVMTRSDWGKKDLKLLKTPNHRRTRVTPQTNWHWVQ